MTTPSTVGAGARFMDAHHGRLPSTFELIVWLEAEASTSLAESGGVYTATRPREEPRDAP